LAIHIHRQKWDRWQIVAGIVARYVLLAILAATLAVAFGLVDLRMGLLLTAAAAIILPFVAWWEYTVRLGR